MKEEKLSETQIQNTVAELQKTINYIEHLLSTFSVWIFEEIVLLLSHRIEVDLVIAVLEEIWHEQLNVDLKNIDKRIFEISIDKASKSAFKESVNSIRNNWGMPISNRWLNT